MAQRTLIAGNWKMNLTVSEAALLAQSVAEIALQNPHVDVAIFPTFVSLYAVAEKLAGTRVALGAQDVFWKSRGAYTGEVSPEMLLDVGCKFCIVGHSERRGRFGVEDDSPPGFFSDTNESIRRKIASLIKNGITPILCVGETAHEREAGQTQSVLETQLAECLEGLQPTTEVVIAYEPVWAIGTGNVCGADEAEAQCHFIHSFVKDRLSTRVLYGGSVNGGNAGELLSSSSIDGALVGGASLKPEEFSKIVSVS